MSLITKNIDPQKWLDNYGDYLFSLAFIKLNNKQTAEDLVQDTLILAFKARESFEHNSSEKTWLTTILNNKIIDYYRKRDVLKNVTEYLSDTDAGFTEHFFYSADGHWLPETAPHSWEEQADGSVNRNEFYKVLHQCIKKMPSKLVPVFMAKFLLDEHSDKICKDHNITSSNYWVIIHRAKVLMRSCLEKNWFQS
ncbi:MAG: sigma-70 family RNA polymerase sigma factor [Chitinophagaceae bacterium]